MAPFNLFFREPEKSDELMKVMDSINARMGAGTLRFAAEGVGKDRPWKVLARWRSPSYTTDWNQLPKVR